MNTLLANLLAGARNGHIRWPIGIAVILHLVPIWFPAYTDKCKETANVLMLYGIIAAANSAPPTPSQTTMAPEVPPTVTK